MSFSANGKSIIGVMGVGVVGGAARDFFERQGRSVRVHDPNLGLGSEASINEADIVFICVPTPHDPRTGFDSRALEEAIGTLQDSKVIVIKSTVLPGTTETYQARFPQHCFLFNPEFLRESTARIDFVRPDRQLVGYTAQSRHLAGALLALLPSAPYERMMVAREAEMTKYMTNAFLALKVTFANEIYDLAAALDIDYEAVREAVAADLRIGSSHLDVTDSGYRGYGGKCLPKDVKALLHLGDVLGLPMHLLRTADRVNGSLLPPGEAPAARPRPLPMTQDEAIEETDERAA